MARNTQERAMSGAAPISPAPIQGSRLTGASLAAVLASLLLTLLLAALDQTIVSTALPHIISELHGSADQYTWVVTTYLLTETTMVPIVGKLSDQFGRKWFVVAGVIIFLIGSMLAGTSNSVDQLIFYRGVQGIGAGMILALIFTLVGDIFTPAERARWQGLFAGTFALASVIGPTLGGWITDHASWRWVFYVNLPLGLLALALLVFRLPNSISIRSNEFSGWAAVRRIDVAGAVSSAGATVALLLGLTWGGQTYAWNSPQVITALALAVILYAAFIVIERFYAKEPILPLDLFRNQIFAAGAGLSLMVGMALFAVVFYLPLFIQGVLQNSATNSGAVITPLTLTLAAGAAVVGLIIARVGRYQWISILGVLVLTFGVFLLSRMTINTTLGEVTRDMIVVGIGLGMLQPVLTLAVQNAIPRNRLGVGTGAVTYLRTLGQTLGTALIGAVVNNVYSNDLHTRLANTVPGVSKVPAKALNVATNQEVLANPGAQHTIVAAAQKVAEAQALHQPSAQAALKGAIAQATRTLTPGSAQYQATTDAVTKQFTATLNHQVDTQVATLFNQIFEAGRQSLAVGIERAFQVGLILCGLIFIITLFLKDVPLGKRAVPATQSVEQSANADALPAVH